MSGYREGEKKFAFFNVRDRDERIGKGHEYLIKATGEEVKICCEVRNMLMKIMSMKR